LRLEDAGSSRVVADIVPTARSDRWPTYVLLFSATLWGVSWWPMQRLAAAGVRGPALSLISYGAVGLVGLPLLWRARARWRTRLRLLLLIAAFGGWANASFVMALTQGDVIREMLLFYLAPAWSVLGARVVLGEGVSARRGLAVVLALVGAYLVIGAGGSVGLGRVTAADALALSAGITFAANNLTTRVAGAIPIASKTVAMMIGCAVFSGLTLAVLGQGIPPLTVNTGLGLLLFSAVWIVAGTATTSYGVTHLQAGRAGLILLAELVASVVSASLINGRIPSAPEICGAAFILAAAAIDIIET
jgi:drug/metabolite transporter (DMT)-like permease